MERLQPLAERYDSIYEKITGKGLLDRPAFPRRRDRLSGARQGCSAAASCLRARSPTRRRSASSRRWSSSTTRSTRCSTGSRTRCGKLPARPSAVRCLTLPVAKPEPAPAMKSRNGSTASKRSTRRVEAAQAVRRGGAVNPIEADAGQRSAGILLANVAPASCLARRSAEHPAGQRSAGILPANVSAGILPVNVAPASCRPTSPAYCRSRVMGG